MPTPPIPPRTPGQPAGGTPPLDRPLPNASSVSGGKVSRPATDLHPKVKAGAMTYVGLLLAGVIAVLTQAQGNIDLSPMAALGVTGGLAILPLLAAYLKPGDGS
jgi:hypothetical protein